MNYKELIGKQAPEFKLKNQNNSDLAIQEVIGKHNIVLYFYPKADTPGCTAESCSFRDNYTDFVENDCIVIGISGDSVSKQNFFKEKHKLPFTLLSDGGGIVRKLYRVPKTFGIIQGRVTFIIDKKGIVRHIFNSQFNATKHVEEAISTIKSWK